ncbi:FliM/FliN family flagellar motor C-terminal domain-containing protein [Erythrobacter sp. MTPC3]|uniref:FliM/FliN family flagellar motor C-terminal domain-containing protein n=1 Tax=Erythrobacter sp. MTPC3 TaxID=3056564 RepID=UPI0036F27860
MKSDQEFTAERPAAQHCAELLAFAQKQGDDGEEAQDFIAAVCRALPDRMQSLLIGKRLRISSEPGKPLTGKTVLQAVNTNHANYIITSDTGLPGALLSIDLPTSVSLTDRLFGGDGDLEGSVPESLPMSAAIALKRVADAAGQALCAAAEMQNAAISVEHNVDLRRHPPFAHTDSCVSWTIKAEQEGTEPWSMRLALVDSDLKLLCAGAICAGSPAPKAEPEVTSGSAPFCDIPLPLHAVLAEMQMPLSRLTNLSPGDVLPIAPARKIPLRLGDETIAHGAIGTIDERIALRLSDIS